MNRVFLLLGSNIGNRMGFLMEAGKIIKSEIGEIKGNSSVYETEPWGFMPENYFLNQVVEVATELKPLELLDRILGIERSFDRKSDVCRYVSRKIDIDILFYNDEIVKGAELEIPHPLIEKRRFVLVPAVELDPDLVHPVFQKKINTLLQECNDNSAVRLYMKASVDEV